MMKKQAYIIMYSVGTLLSGTYAMAADLSQQEESIGASAQSEASAVVTMASASSSSLTAAAPLTLDSCRALALENNKNLLVARKMTEKYGYDVKAYRANYFPNFKLMLNDAYSNASGSLPIHGGYLPTYVYNSTAGSLVPNVLTDASGNVVMGSDGMPVFKEYAFFPDMDIKYKFENIFQAGVTVEQPIYMGGKITAAYKMSKIGKEMAQMNETLTQSEVIVETETAYMLLVKAQEMNKVAVRLRDMLQELLANVQSGFKHGMTSQNDVLKVQVKLNESELKVRQTENALHLASMNLCHVTGQPLTKQLTVVAEDMLVAPAAADESADIMSRPEYEILNKKAELAAQQVNLERSEFLPHVAVGGAFNYMNGFKVNDDKLFDKPSLSVLLTVSMPLFHFGEGMNKVRSAKAEKEKTLLEQRDLIEQMNLELAQAANNLDEAFLEVQLTQKSVQQAEDNMHTCKCSYELGLETLVNYMESQTLWQQAYANLINAQSSLFVQGSKYRKAAGMMLP